MGGFGLRSVEGVGEVRGWRIESWGKLKVRRLAVTVGAKINKVDRICVVQRCDVFSRY
jgi:hypothetical protein